MIFETFLRDLRRQKNLTQAQLANMLFISEKTLSGYETNRRQCTFNFAIEILNKLNISILIENNEIKVVQGDINMTREYKNEDLNFINFNTEKYLLKIQEYRNRSIKQAKENFEKAYKRNESLRFETSFTSAFSEELWFDECYDNGTELAIFEKDNKKMSLMVLGYFETDFFVIEEFIRLLKEYSGKEIADFVFKSILYTENVHNNGFGIYRLFKNKKISDITNLIPMIKNYESDIKYILDNHEKEIFKRIIGGYDYLNMTIANDLCMYDCFSTPYIYFVYTMEDGNQVVNFEDNFEGHSIDDAFNYVNEYFEDFDRYEEGYKNIDGDNGENLTIL